MMDNGGGNRLARRFDSLKERQDDMHRRFMDKWSNVRERETQEVNHTRQFMRPQAPTQNNKSTSKNKQYGTNKISNTTPSNEQSNSNTNNNKSGNFSNGPTQDLLQASHKRTFDQFNGVQSANDEARAKVSRLSDQNKQQFNRSNSNTSYDVNSNVQPNMNPFQTNIDKEKAKLTLPGLNLGMPSKKVNTINTPQVVKDVEKLLEQSDNLKLQNNVKIESVTPSNTPPVTNTDTGFDENIRFYGEYLKTEVKIENETTASKSDMNTKTQVSINNQMPGNANSTQQIQSQQQKMKSQSSLPTQQQHQIANQNQMPNQNQIPNQNQMPNQHQMPNQQLQNQQQQQMMNQTPISNQQQKTSQQTQQQWQNSIKNANQNAVVNRNLANRSTQQTLNMNSSMQMLSGNMGNSNPQMMAQVSNTSINQQQQQPLQQLSQQNYSNNSNMMNQAPLNLNNSMNPNTNMMSSNNSSAISSGMMSGNSTHLNTQPPSLPRLNQTPNVRQILDRVITNKDANSNQGQQISQQQQYLSQQNHVGPYTNGKLQDLLKRRQMKSNQQHPISNQMMPQLPTPAIPPQSSFMYNNEVGMNNQQHQMNNMQPQQNGMGYFPPPYQMDNPNSQMFGNNSGGYFPQNINKPAGKMLQELSTQRQLNGMYGMHQNMSQQQMFSMGNKAPPRYTNQMNANMMNQAAMMNMNTGMNTSARLTHFSQPDSGNMGLRGPPGMKSQMGIRNMNAMNRFPPPLSRNMMQNSANLATSGNNQIYESNYMNQDMNNFSNMGNSANSMMTPEQQQIMMRNRVLRYQQQQQMMSQQQQQQHQQNNIHYQPMLNSDNNVQHIMQQQQQQQQLVNNSDTSNTNSNNNQLSTNMHQSQYAGNFIQQQQQPPPSSNSLQGNLQQSTQQMQPHPQQSSTQQATQQQYSQQTSISSSSSVATSLTNNTLTDTSASLLETTNNDGNTDLPLPDESSIDEILENPSDQFDLIEMFS